MLSRFGGFCYAHAVGGGRPEPEQRAGRTFCGGSHGNDGDQASRVASATSHRGSRRGSSCCRGGGSPRTRADNPCRRRQRRYQRPLSTRIGSRALRVGRQEGREGQGAAKTKVPGFRRCPLARLIRSSAEADKASAVQDALLREQRESGGLDWRIAECRVDRGQHVAAEFYPGRLGIGVHLLGA
jgi:hypothetical protein